MKREQKRQPRELTPFHSLLDLKDARKGEKCFIGGAGPSIGFMNLDEIHKHVVITVNSAILLMNWKTGEKDKRFWISNDSLCLQWSYFWKDVLRAHCQKLVRTSWKPHDEKIRGHGFRYFAARKKERAPLSNDGKYLCAFSSTPTAADLAILLGCKEVYLLGIDHKMVDGKSHFWQFWPKKKWPQRKGKEKNYRPEQTHQIQRFKRNKYSYIALRELANRLGVSIYNCSTRTIISDSIFPKMSLERALKM